ncbi:MAG TPA: sodium:proton antiporter, partial [Gammaproteobacteria bacterium]|nr:sodium:proton antiporter [Gammaproteobacteria bacterium]
MEHINAGAQIALIIALGIGAQWLAWRLRFPAIVLLLLTGLVAGPVVFGVIQPDAAFGDLLHPVIGLAVAIILFDGGLNLQLHELKTAAKGVRRLVYLGIPLSWLFGTLAAYFIGGQPLPVSLVFGAIVVVTGPTVILPLLRHAMLNRRTASYLKWEGIVNDPLGALLAVITLQYFVFSAVEDVSLNQVLAFLGQALVAGGGIGMALAFGAAAAFKRGWVPEYLKVPITITLILCAYTGANLIQPEAGLLAVTIMGVTMGNLNLPSMQEMKRFKEYITVILVSMVFIVLTADIDPALLQALDWHAAALIATIIFIARPLMVWIATLGAGMNWRDKLLVGWIAPRGIVAAAVSGVFAVELAEAGYEGAHMLVALVFGLILATVVLHGFTMGPLARWLGLASHKRNRILIVGASPWSTGLASQLMDSGANVLLVDSSWHRLRSARLSGVAVYYGEILSDNADQALELNDIGTLLAATSNDAYNALVCNAFAPELSHNHVFQLAMYDADDDDPRGVARPMRGRVAFDEQALYEELWRKFAAGWLFQKTRLTDNYSYEDYQHECAQGTLELFVLRNDDVLVFSPQEDIAPREGDVIISFGPKKTGSIHRT